MISFLMVAAAALSAPPTDATIVTELDRTYQAAVKRNDADAMDRILHPQFQLVLGTGKKISRDELLGTARSKAISYEL